MQELTLLFLVRRQEVLLAMKKRGFGEGKWNGVGGKLKPDETVQDALLRECREEIGVIPANYGKRAEIIFDEFNKSKRKKLKVHIFTCDEWDGEPKESEEMRPKWFDINSLPFELMWSDDPYWLPSVLGGKTLKCRFKLDAEGKIIKKEILEVSSL